MYVSLDSAAQELEVWRLERGSGRPAIAGGNVPIARDEPLRLELVDFIDAIRTKRPPTVDGEAGRKALELATRVARAIDQETLGNPDERHV
jgi:predicted dehydrogenase